MWKDFNEYFDDIIGTLQLTTNERKHYKESLTYSLKRWEIKKLIKQGDLPNKDERLIQEWMMDMDKGMVAQMVVSLEKRIMNYRRKIFGMIGSTPSKGYISHMVNQMMREGLPIFYQDQDVVDKFFRGDAIE
jgi:hypothetical protein